jgi:hypothetical protein
VLVDSLQKQEDRDAQGRFLKGRSGNHNRASNDPFQYSAAAGPYERNIVVPCLGSIVEFATVRVS